MTAGDADGRTPRSRARLTTTRHAFDLGDRGSRTPPLCWSGGTPLRHVGPCRSLRLGQGDHDPCGPSDGRRPLVASWLDPGARQLLDQRRGFYALAVRLVGLRPGLLYAEPAVVAALTISVGVLLTLEGHRVSAGFAGAVAVVVLLAFATPAMDFWFVGKGFHVATALYALVAFGALRRGRFGWGWALAVALLAFGMLGDLMIVAFAVAPLFVSGLVLGEGWVSHLIARWVRKRGASSMSSTLPDMPAPMKAPPAGLAHLFHSLGPTLWAEP